MKALLLPLAAAIATNFVQVQAFQCDIPSSGCLNGMFSTGTCECDCIPPFCRDGNGECADATKSCPNPFTDCTRGVNCPWWSNPQNSESCTTGPKIPPGLYQVYNTKEICCKANFPYSTICDATPKTTQPTKYPSISSPIDDDFEVVVMSMELSNLSMNRIDCDKLWSEMEDVAKRQLLRAQDRIPGMKVTNMKARRFDNSCRADQTRRLQQDDLTMYFTVDVVRDDDKKFGPAIIQYFRDSKNEIIADIQSYTDTQIFASPGAEPEFVLNFCTTRNGKYDLCMIDKTTPAPNPVPFSPVNTMADPEQEKEGAIPVWLIVVIILLILLLLCCIVYGIFVGFFRDNYDNKEIHNNMYMDGRNQDSDYNRSRVPAIMDGERRLAIMDDRSRAPRTGRTLPAIMDNRDYDRGLPIMDDRGQSQTTGYTSARSAANEHQLVLTGQQDPSLDDGSFTINTRGKKKKSRDPTMYIPGQEDRPDPNSSAQSFSSRTSSRRYYSESPSLKSKRDPTMYVDGQRDPTMYVEGKRDPSQYLEGKYDAEDPPLKPKRDPTMYIDGHQNPSIYVEDVSVKDAYDDRGGEQFGMADIDENGDSFHYGQGSANRSRDPSFYDEDPSFITDEPSISSKLVRSSKSKNKNKKKYADDDWDGTSNPNVSNRSGEQDDRQTKSFYN